MAADRRWASRNREYEQMKSDLSRLEAELKQHREEALRLGRDLDHFRKQQVEGSGSTSEMLRLRQSRHEADKMISSLEGMIADLETALAQKQRATSK
jgi:predicted RNase H-like nuclease (RuvC/YqgF family)